jgi:alkylhydroperoxidase family enzyme
MFDVPVRQMRLKTSRRSNHASTNEEPAMIVPGAMQALLALDKASANDDVPYVTRKLVHLRASQINGCGGHACARAEESRRKGRAHLRRGGLAGDAVFHRCGTCRSGPCRGRHRLSDRADPVPDDIWDEATRHYDEQALAALIIQIALINAFNRLNATTRQVAGAWG